MLFNNGKSEFLTLFARKVGKGTNSSPNSQNFHLLFFCFASTSFVILRFSVKAVGEQFEIKPPHFTVFHRIHHFAWVKFQTILSHILNVIVPSSSKLSNWSSPICFGKLSLFGESFLRHFAYMAKPSKTETFQKSNVSMFKRFSNLRAMHLVKQCNSFGYS